MTCENSSIKYLVSIICSNDFTSSIIYRGNKEVCKQAATTHGGSTHIGLSDFQNYVACVTI